jgi:hypothetical protein
MEEMKVEAVRQEEEQEGATMIEYGPVSRADRDYRARGCPISWQ